MPRVPFYPTFPYLFRNLSKNWKKHLLRESWSIRRCCTYLQFRCNKIKNVFKKSLKNLTVKAVAYAEIFWEGGARSSGTPRIWQRGDTTGGVGLSPKPAEAKGVWGRSSQPPTNFCDFCIKHTHFGTLLYRKRACSECSQYRQGKKYFRSLCLKSEAWLKYVKGGCNHY